MDKKVFARFPFNYCGKDLERGEIFQTNPNALRNNQLLSMRYMIEFDPLEHTVHKCLNCPKEFAGYAYLTGHRAKKGGCMAPVPLDKQGPNKGELAEILNVDETRLKVEPETDFTAQDLPDPRMSVGNL